MVLVPSISAISTPVLLCADGKHKEGWGGKAKRGGPTYLQYDVYRRLYDFLQQ